MYSNVVVDLYFYTSDSRRAREVDINSFYIGPHHRNDGGKSVIHIFKQVRPEVGMRLHCPRHSSQGQLPHHEGPYQIL